MTLLRTFAERLSRDRAFVRRLPAEFGRTPLFVSPDSQLKYLKPGPLGFDVALLRLARNHIRPDSVVWDVGANVGVFSFAAASLATQGHTIAFEPDPWLADLMGRSQRLTDNRALHLDVVCTAASEHDGISRFHVARRGRASSSLVAVGGRSEMGGTRHELVVPTLRLDTALRDLPTPTFVKIDVEGAEALVLRGAHDLLEQVRPSLYIEVGDATNDEVTARLRAAGYTLYDADIEPAERVEIHRCVFNTLAVPGAGSRRSSS